ncbi:hypothetical protein INT45_011879 [Circinella minor]|uniref:Uncharacterized protein n=1 Tax=Circinella minor TaxID=1195481 RepID=A0A8H7RWA9_9FUNG|nr:hypothetical protein INT45_011879 [Circinella minor]
MFSKFEELENDYPDYITSANITSHSFIITFRAPLMLKYVNFKAFPCITDVTYKAFPKDRYLWMVMDFSLSQKNGYLSAYNIYTCGMTDGLKYLKGCYMHWMQSVQCISSIHAVVPVDKHTTFLELTVKLCTTVDDTGFNVTCNNIVSEFPDTCKWLLWWLQPDVRSMIFVNGSIMKHSLRFHVCRTSNAIESFHRVFNTLIKGGQPLRSTLRRALKLVKSDQDDLSQFYEYGMLTTYNRQQKL